MAANGGRSLRKPVFVKVESLKPGTSGHTVVVKVVNCTTVLHKGAAASPHLRNTRIAECLVGDDTASILFTARNDQVDLMKPGTTVILRNAKIDMFKGSMRLAVDKWGRIEVTDEPASFVVKEDNNLSLVEYELGKALYAIRHAMYNEVLFVMNDRDPRRRITGMRHYYGIGDPIRKR